MFWVAAKQLTRKYCSYSFKDLEIIVRQALQITSIAIMRRFARISLRNVDIYRSGREMTPKQIEYAMKKCSFDRTIPVAILELL